jgi:hypothetical protein
MLWAKIEPPDEMPAAATNIQKIRYLNSRALEKNTAVSLPFDFRANN